MDARKCTCSMVIFCFLFCGSCECMHINNNQFLQNISCAGKFAKLRHVLATIYRISESMALLGKSEQYDPEQEEWLQYVERLEQFIKANDLTGDSKVDKRRATSLSIIGPVPYKLLRSLLAPAKPKEKKYDEQVAKITEHYSLTLRSCNAYVSTPD